MHIIFEPLGSLFSGVGENVRENAGDWSLRHGHQEEDIYLGKGQGKTTSPGVL